MLTKIVLYPKIGQLVYRSFSPQTVGIIRADRTAKSLGETIHLVTVEWITPSGKKTIEKNIDSERLNSFDWLIEDHKKKLKTHLATQKRMKKFLKG